MPERAVTTAELAAQVPETWGATRIAARTPIAARQFVAPGTTAATLGAAALPEPPRDLSTSTPLRKDSRSRGRSS